MIDSELHKKIKSTMSKSFGVSIKEINDKTSFLTLDKWDSLNHVALIIALEKEFDINLNDELTINMVDYESIFSTLKRLVT